MRRPILVLSLLLAPALASTQPASTPTPIPVPAPAPGPAGLATSRGSVPAQAAPSRHAVILKDGTRLECVEAPLVAMGRVLYKTADGARHALPVDKVDLEKTRPAAPPPPTQAGAALRQAAATKPATSAPPQRRPAPDFEAKRADGTVVKLSDLRGKVVLVDFWATWCGPCVMEMPNVKKLHQKHAGPDFEILGVSLDRSRVELDAYLKAQGITWPQAFDGKMWSNAVAQQYGVSSIPAMLLVDREGRVARAGVRGPMLEQAVADLLAEPRKAPAAASRKSG